MGPSKAEDGRVRTQMTAEERQAQKEIPDSTEVLYQSVMKSPGSHEIPILPWFFFI